MIFALVGSTGHTPYWWAFKMLNKGDVLAGEGKSLHLFGSQNWVKEALLNPTVKYIQKSGGQESDKVTRLGERRR